MYAHKWLSNSPAVLAKIPVEERASEINLINGHLPSVKTLGLLWLANEDVFSFRSSVHEESSQLTKRAILKRIALLFDPLGMPFSIYGKERQVVQNIPCIQVHRVEARRSCPQKTRKLVKKTVHGFWILHISLTG